MRDQIMCIAHELQWARDCGRASKKTTSRTETMGSIKSSFMYLRMALRRMDNMINDDSYKEFDVASERTCCPSKTGEPHNGYCSSLYQGPSWTR